MATLEQLEEGIRRAHAAGNAEHVRALGQEYRRLQAEQGRPRTLQGDMSGRKASFNERSENIEDARPNPMKSTLPSPLGGFQDFSNAVQSGFNQGLTLGFGDEIYAGATAPIRAIPGLLSGEGYDLGKAYEQGLQETRAVQQGQQALNPIAAGAGEITGAIANPATRLAIGSQAASLPARMGIGALEGAAIGGTYGFGSADGDLQSRLEGAGKGAMTGGAFGAVAPAVAQGVGNTVSRMAQRGATNAAIKGAPSAAELKAASQAMFKKVDDSGVTVDARKFGDLVADMVQKQTKQHLNETLHPNTTAALKEFVAAANDVLRGNGRLTISDLHTLRQIAQEAAMSKVGKDGFRAGQIIDALDDFMSKSGNLNLPRNALPAPGAGPNTAGNNLLDAISLWHRSSKTGRIESAIYNAQNAASGFENGLRNEFRSLLRNDKFRATLTRAEREAIEDVVRGTTSANLAKLIGKFGFGSGQATNVMGGFLGGMGGFAASGGNPLAAAAVAAGASGARKASEKLTQKAAERAARVMATPNVPNVPQINLPAPPTALALPAIDAINRPQ